MCSGDADVFEYVEQWLIATPPPTDTRSQVNDPAKTAKVDAATLDAATLARLSLRPTIQAAITATKLLKPLFKADLDELLTNEQLRQLDAARDCDVSRTEGMMVTQAQTLDLLFHKFTRTAVQNIGHYPDTIGLDMKLALRAQSQCRVVAETLHEMKNPRPVAFFQHANIAMGRSK